MIYESFVAERGSKEKQLQQVSCPTNITNFMIYDWSAVENNSVTIALYWILPFIRVYIVILTNFDYKHVLT